MLREERRLRVFENRVLRGVFGGRRDEVTGEWRKLHNAELNDLYCFKCCPDYEIEKNGMGGACSMYGEELYIVFWWGNLGERDHWGDAGVDGDIILRLIFGNVGYGLD
jgi:hypothetical protein